MLYVECRGKFYLAGMIGDAPRYPVRARSSHR